MDKRIAIWNILHDGEITAFSGEEGETLTIFINIPFLRRRLEPLGDSFVVTLLGTKRFEFYNSDGSVTQPKEEIDLGTPEILSTRSKEMPIRIETTMGYLILDFRDVRFALDTGQEIEYEAISKVCEEYWTQWAAKAEERRRNAQALGPS